MGGEDRAREAAAQQVSRFVASTAPAKGHSLPTPSAFVTVQLFPWRDGVQIPCLESGLAPRLALASRMWWK